MIILDKQDRAICDSCVKNSVMLHLPGQTTQCSVPRTLYARCPLLQQSDPVGNTLSGWVVSHPKRNVV